MAAVLKTAEVMSLRGFESLSLRQDSNTNSLILRPWLAERAPL